MERTAALFLDFDNIYGSLADASKTAANSFAENPLSWLKWFEDGHYRDSSDAPVPQNIALRACYLNPAMFGKYRKNFVYSGFKTIDCPALTGQGKNSADIHMVLDILDALNHNTTFDEFIILSADADFTPVLLRLREWRRATSVISTAVTSSALRNAATDTIDIDRFISDALNTDAAKGESEAGKIGSYVKGFIESNGSQLADDLPGIVIKKFPSFRESNWLDYGTRRAWIAAMVTAHPSLVLTEQDGQETLRQKTISSQGSKKSNEDLKSQVIAFIEREVLDEGGPLDGASIGYKINKEFGPKVKEEKWFGYGRLTDFINSSDVQSLVISDNMITMLAGDSSSANADPFDACSVEIREFIDKLSSVGWPRLSPKQLNLILESAFKLIKEGVVERNPLSASIRDDIRNQIEVGTLESRYSVGRQNVNLVLTRLLSQGVSFSSSGLDIHQLKTGMWSSMTEVHENMLGEPTEREYEIIDEIFGVESQYIEEVV
ncbi:NYN domain-containing protein [Yoonia sp. 208BN28-4]|uniref:NYN domain-containing protein n=1 Tax=Yoonia sp. 208BN28-4 TaxID=3126505 RepID=UPI0030A6B784